MKSPLLKLLFLGFTVFLFSSCSQQQELVNHDRATYKYKKVYVGNRIVYRENTTEIAPKSISPTIATQTLAEIKAPKKAVDIQEGAIRSEKEKETAATTFKKDTWFSRTANMGMRKATDFWLKKNNIEAREDRLTEKQATQSLNGIFAIVGFVLGLIGILGFIGSGFAGIGIGAAIAAIIFSALGLRSEYSTLAYIGLIFSIIVLVALLLI